MVVLGVMLDSLWSCSKMLGVMLDSLWSCSKMLGCDVGC